MLFLLRELHANVNSEKAKEALLGIVAGITKLGARVGEQVAKNTKLK